MDMIIVIVVSAAAGVIVGGFLFYTYGKSVQQKAQALEQAAKAEVKKL